MLSEQAAVAEQPVSLTDAASGYGLRRHVLSPIETLGQSISTIAPSTSPTMTIPLVFALAGNGTWLSYLLATAAVMLVAMCIRSFAQESSSPGSLYSYATTTLPPMAGSLAAWALLLAYIATGASVIGGFVNYAGVMLALLSSHHVPPALYALLVTAVSVVIASRDIKLSTRLMLAIEGSSVLLIAIVLAALFLQRGWHFDLPQLRFAGSSIRGIRLGMVLALFSFVGFESATTLGAEAREPLRTIPRAVLQSAILCGVFFILSAYGETMAYRPANLAETTAPFQRLAGQVGMPLLAPLIDAGVLISMFAATLGCITAAARVLLLMARNGLTHSAMGRTHVRYETPAIAVAVVGTLACLPAAVLSMRGASGADIYGWLGSLATYGFITVYAMVAVALPLHLKRLGRLRPVTLVIAIAAVLAMLLAAEGSLYPVPPAPYSWLPYVYLVYLGAAAGLHQWQRPRLAV